MEYIIKPEEWKQKEPNPVDGTPDEDQKYYVSIPFECDPDEDVVMKFTDSDDYIQEHKADFDSLNNGDSDGKFCTISADTQPTCEMKIDITTVEKDGGRVVYDKNGNPEYLPPNNGSSLGALAGMFGGMGGMGGMPNIDMSQLEGITGQPEVLEEAEVVEPTNNTEE